MLDVDGEIAVADVAPGEVRDLVERAACRCCGEAIERAVTLEWGELEPAGEWTHVATLLERCGPIFGGDVGGGA